MSKENGFQPLPIEPHGDQGFFSLGLNSYVSSLEDALKPLGITRFVPTKEQLQEARARAQQEKKVNFRLELASPDKLQKQMQAMKSSIRLYSGILQNQRSGKLGDLSYELEQSKAQLYIASQRGLRTAIKYLGLLAEDGAQSVDFGEDKFGKDKYRSRAVIGVDGVSLDYLDGRQSRVTLYPDDPADVDHAPLTLSVQAMLSSGIVDVNSHFRLPQYQGGEQTFGSIFDHTGMHNPPERAVNAARTDEQILTPMSLRIYLWDALSAIERQAINDYEALRLKKTEEQEGS